MPSGVAVYQAVKPHLIYPVPLDNSDCWATFKPFVERFIRSLWEHDPGCEYELVAILCIPADSSAEPRVAEAQHLFDGLPVNFCFYHGGGFDIGAFQHYAQTIPQENVFMVCAVSRVFAWKCGWLARLAQAREMCGPGLYGTSISREGGKLHVCTRLYCTDSDTFKKYPTQITSRDLGTFFEVYEGNFHDFHKLIGLPSFIVYWDGVCDVSENDTAHCWRADNIYRQGDQSNILIFDKHSQAYADASPDRKRELEDACFLGYDLSKPRETNKEMPPVHEADAS